MKGGIYCSPYFGQRTGSPEYRQTGDRNHACDPFDPGPRGTTTEEAVELLNQYDMFAASGRDYHFLYRRCFR